MYLVAQDAEAEMTKDEAAMYAISVCGYLEEGYSSGDVMVFMMSDTDSIDPYLHARLVGGAVGAFCPKFAAQIDQEWP